MDELATRLNAVLEITSDEIMTTPHNKDKTPLDIDITIHEQTSRPPWADFVLPVEQFPVLPLEVVNYYCRTHFDDEDFVYVQFELPQAIQSIIASSGCSDIILYLRQTLATMVNGDVEYERHVIDTHERIIGLYDKVLDYNMTIEAEMEPDADLWPNTYLDEVSNVCSTIVTGYNLDMNAPLYKNTAPYYREIYYGLGLIISQLCMICDYYYNKQGISNPINFSKHHRERFMRLVNNLCIIMIHNNFMWSNTLFRDDMDEYIDPYESQPDAIWYLKYPKC
jgi:hypothetical protein